MSASRGASLVFALAAAAGHARASQRISYSGYIIDYYCLGRMEMGLDAFDGSDILRAPEGHTLHCLRDVPQCREGFYLAQKDSEGVYRPKFNLDDASHTEALALMDSFERNGAHGRDYKPFAVTAVGTHDGDGVLKGATFTACFPDIDDGCDGVCVAGANGTEACDAATSPPAFTMPARPLLVLHVVCMCLSWGCLLPLGVLWARNMRDSKWKPGGVPAWFQGHRTLQSVGVLLQLLGFIFIYAYKGHAGHFKAPHEQLGLVVIVLGVLQPVNAALRHLPFIGHPNADGSRTTARAAWEFYHKGCGWVCLALGVANVIFGPIFANDLRFTSSLVTGAAVFLALSLGTLLIGGAFLEVKRLLSPPAQTQKVVSEASGNNESSAKV